MFTFLASLVAAGSLFQLFTTLWLKNVLWPLFSLSLILSGSCHSFRVLCCHPKPHILVHFVHLRNNFVRLYHVHCSCPLFSFPMSPVLSLCIFLHMCVLSDLISFFTACCCTLSKTLFSSAIHGAHTGAANSTCGSMYCTWTSWMFSTLCNEMLAIFGFALLFCYFQFLSCDFVHVSWVPGSHVIKNSIIFIG